MSDDLRPPSVGERLLAFAIIAVLCISVGIWRFWSIDERLLPLAIIAVLCISVGIWRYWSVYERAGSPFRKLHIEIAWFLIGLGTLVLLLCLHHWFRTGEGRDLVGTAA